MKRVLLLGMILAICILAFPQGVAAAFEEGNKVVINADYYTATDFDASRIIPSGGWSWPLYVGYDNTYTDAIRIHLLTQADWDIKAADTTAGQVEDGYLLGTANDADHNLQNPFRVEAKNGDMVDLKTSKKLAEGNALDSEQGWNADIDQKVVAADYGSPGGWSAEITFTCTAGF